MSQDNEHQAVAVSDNFARNEPEAQVDSIFGDIWSGVKKATRIVKTVAPIIPGVGPKAVIGLEVLDTGMRILSPDSDDESQEAQEDSDS
jgi:hypothetical protein